MLSTSLVPQEFVISKKENRKKKNVKATRKASNAKKALKEERKTANNSKDYTVGNQNIEYTGGELWKNSTLLMESIR